MFSFLFKDSSLESPKKKEVVTGESEMKPRIGVMNQDPGISLDISSSEENISYEEMESRKKKLEEELNNLKKQMQKTPRKHQSGKLLTFSAKGNPIILSKTLEKLLKFV